MVCGWGACGQVASRRKCATSSWLGVRRIPPAEPVVAAKKPRNIRFPEDDLITSYYLKHPEVRARDVL